MTALAFADLSHTGAGVSANNNPLAVAYVAAYATAQLGSAVQPRLFKYPQALSAYLRAERPRIASFSHYMWNARLTTAFAAALHRHSPEVVTVMGGPNYPLVPDEQHAYLVQHPEIDFYVDGEGEVPFVALFEALAAVSFDKHRLRRSGVRIPGVHYVVDGEFIHTGPSARILDLDATLPSPYTMGLLDEFFDEKLTPMVQTSRGCPYSCTFCHDGIAYMNKTRQFSLDRVDEELHYVAARVKTPTLQLADLNFGMFPSDLQTTEIIARIRQETGWPRNVMVATAKNQKDRMVQMSAILGDVLQVGASVQSTDTKVLQLAKRTNISLEAVTRMTMGASNGHTGSFTEIILGLPGDTKAAHRRSVYDMLDAGVQDARLFQFILLPGTEGASADSRERHGYFTGFRVLARCFGRYDVMGESVSVTEVQEICLGTNTMPREDYDDCRAFDLTVAMFNNGGVLKEFFRLGEMFGIPRSVVLELVAELAHQSPELASVYEELRTQEAKNFFATEEALEAFLAAPGTMDRYLAGEFGVNHIYHARTVALTTLIDTLSGIARDAVAEALRRRGQLDNVLEDYLDELHLVSVARKSGLTELDRVTELRLHFDFPAQHAADYRLDPRDIVVPGGAVFSIRHSEAQRHDLQRFFVQYGDGLPGIEQFIQRNDSHVSSMLYRGVEHGVALANREASTATLADRTA